MSVSHQEVINDYSPPFDLKEAIEAEKRHSEKCPNCAALLDKIFDFMDGRFVVGISNRNHAQMEAFRLLNLLESRRKGNWHGKEEVEPKKEEG